MARRDRGAEQVRDRAGALAVAALSDWTVHAQAVLVAVSDGYRAALA